MSGPQRVSLYICSTGADMAAERRHLRTVILPELQARVADLNVEIVSTDLFEEAGWAEAADAEWLQRALGQIDRCRLFIALVGERYGPPLSKLPDELAATYPRLAGLTGLSRFALEITHVLAGSRKAPNYIRLYQRRPTFLTGVPAPARTRFEAESERAAEQLDTLKAELRALGAELREYDCGWDALSGDICDLTQFHTLVLEDLEASLRDEIAQAKRAFPTLPMSTHEGLDVTAVPVTFPAAPAPSSERGVPDAATPPPKVYDENVQFTVYRPQVVEPQRWYTMLAFAHLSERRADADDSEPDPVQEVERQARQMLGDDLGKYVSAGSKCPQNAELICPPNPSMRSAPHGTNRVEGRHAQEGGLDGD